MSARRRPARAGLPAGDELAAFHRTAEVFEVVLEFLLEALAEGGGDPGAELAGWRVILERDDDFRSAAGGQLVEMDAAGGIDRASGKRSPRNDFVLALVDDFGVPLDGTAERDGRDPVGMEVIGFVDALEVLHDFGEVFQLAQNL